MWHRLTLGVALAAGLAACEPIPYLTGPPTNTVRLAGAVTLTGPSGYCVDPVVTKPRKGFALLAACAAMTADETDIYPDNIALVTVQVGAADSAAVAGQEDAFGAFMETPQGAALLSASAIGGPVLVRLTQTDTNIVAVYTEDVDAPGISGTQKQAWRLFTDVRGRLVTVSVRGLTEAPLTQSASRALLDAVVGAMHQANVMPSTTT